MSRVFKLDIRESQEELEELLRKETHVRKRERLQFLYWYKSGLATTRKGLGHLLNRSQFALSRWIKTYQKGGLRGLLNLGYQGGNLAPSIPPSVRAHLKARLDQPEGFDSYKAIQRWLKETYDLEVPYSTVFGTVKYQLKATLKVPRPVAVKQDPTAVEGFKKKLPDRLQEIAKPCLKRYNSIRYWAQDESRFGLKTRLRRRLTRRGVKPRVSVQWPFKAFYTYGIVEPLTGEVMIRPFDQVNAVCFQQFLNDFARQSPDDFHVVQVDNARFHCAAALVMPDNVMLLYQPPYSPEVNAAERLWQWSKRETANQIFADLETLKETIKGLFMSQPKPFFASLTAQSFIFDALRKVGLLPNSA